MQKAIVILLLGVIVGSLAPGRLQAAGMQRITITMRDFSYSPDTVSLQAGVPAEITLINRGKVRHGFMVHPRPRGQVGADDLRDWAGDHSYFIGLRITVTGQGVDVGRKGPSAVEVKVAAGKTAVIAFTPTQRGTFEFACLIEGHYEAGQKGTLTVK